MESFENFQYESGSTYGGMSIVDDNSSVYTVNTTSQSNLPVDLEGLSITDDRSVTASPTGNGSAQGLAGSRAGIDDDFDAVLDDLKDEGQVDLPPHACRQVCELVSPGTRTHCFDIAIAAFTLQPLW